MPLRPASGYWLSFTTDSRGGPVRWRLTGNHPEFEPQSKRLPLDGFTWLGSSSWSGSNVCVFPNQIQQHMPIEDLRTAASRPPGVQLVDAKLFGRRHDVEYEVSIDVRLISGGPASVPATDVIRILLQGGGNLLQPYAGGGKYELRGDTRHPAPAPKVPLDLNGKAAGPSRWADMKLMDWRERLARR